MYKSITHTQSFSSVYVIEELKNLINRHLVTTIKEEFTIFLFVFACLRHTT